MTPLSKSHSDSPTSHLRSLSLSKISASRQVTFTNGGSVRESAGELYVSAPDGTQKILAGSLKLENDSVKICFGSWNQTISANGEHHISRVSADFARGEAVRTNFRQGPGSAPAVASEQLFDGSEFRTDKPICWQADGQAIVLKSSLGETRVVPAVPLTWSLRRP